jgi:two-component system response regulator DevR
MDDRATALPVGERAEPRGLISVYVVDDHDLVRDMLVQVIGDADGLIVVGSAATMQRALSEIPHLRPAVAVLDGRLPDGTGLDLCRALKAVAPGVACLVLTAATNIDWGPEDAARAGAAGYLTKTIKTLPLIETIRAVAAGRDES